MSSKKPAPKASNPKYGQVNARPVPAGTGVPALPMSPGDSMRHNFRENIRVAEETLSPLLSQSVTGNLMRELETEIVATRAALYLLAEALLPFRNHGGVECDEPKGDTPEPYYSPLNQRLSDNIKILRGMQAFMADVAVEIVS